MKKILLSIGLISSTIGFTQTSLYTNDFEGAPGFDLNTNDESGTTTGMVNPWVINNIYAGGSGSFFCTFLASNIPFTVPAAANQPGAITNSPNSQHLHVTPQIAIDDGGATLPAASYVTHDGFCIFGGQSTFAAMNTDFSTVGSDSVELDLWWMCGGSSMYHGEVFYSVDGGTNWVLMQCPTTMTNQWLGQSTWTNSQVSDPAWANQATLRFGFRFLTPGGTTGSELDPGFAIDEISVTGFNVCTPTSSTITPTACDSYISPSGNYTYTTTGMYNDTIPNMAGCDSVITVDVTINTVDNNVTQAGNDFTADQAGATYQWLDCGNSFSVIAGATSQTYMATANGDYAVEVTINGCVDTSTCYAATGIGFEEDVFGDALKLYPNPTNGQVFIELNDELGDVEVIVKNIEGKLVSRQVYTDNSLITFNLEGERGVYLVEIVSGELRQHYRIVKQ